MIDYLSQFSDINLFCFLSFVSIVFSIIAIVVIKRYVPLSLRYTDNAVIGNTINLVSVIYGVLAGLSALYLINNNGYASDAVQREANSVANIYRDSNWLSEPTRSQMHTELEKYLTTVINTEWPVMEKGGVVANDGDAVITQISDQLHAYSQLNGTQFLVLRDMLEEVKNLYDARQQRIQKSYSSLSPELWVVILVGTILTLCINYLFGMNFYLHILTVIAAALMTSSMIFLLITLDKPFQGEFIIEPVPFAAVLSFIKQGTFQPVKAVIEKKVHVKKG
jgi:hypothetical protein